MTSQIYNTPHGPALLIRLDDRGKGPEYMFGIVKQEMMQYTWAKTLPDDFELVHDPGSRAETEIFKAEANALVREKGVLLECLGAALAMMDERVAEQVRGIYRAKIKSAELISKTKGA